MLPEIPAARYHAGHDPRLAEALVNSREAASIAAIYREVRSAIYAGEYQPGSQLPTRAQLAKVKGVSAESVTIVMRMLAAEGLVSSEQGRGTFVLGRRRYQAETVIPRAGGTPVGASEGDTVTTWLEAAADDEPAASGLKVRYRYHEDAGTAPPSLVVYISTETGGPQTAGLAAAVAVALGVVRTALAGRSGWDLSAASVTARPADGDQEDA